MVAIMDKRSQLFQMFGPKLIEAFLELILAELNELRTRRGLPPRTKQQLYDQIIDHVTHLPDYDWMTEQENFPP